jgi:hypothetical protein
MFVDVAWDTVFHIAGSSGDAQLLIPRLIAAQGGWVYVYDYGDWSVKAFDAEGTLRWTFGRRGEGPGEFDNPFTLKVGPDGTLWVFDPGVGRMTGLSRSGSLERAFRVEGPLVTRIAPIRDAIIALTVGLKPFWLGLDSEGKVIATGETPLTEISEVAPLARGALAASEEPGRIWAVTFIFGDRLLVYEGFRLRCQGRLVEGREFPSTVDRDTPPSAIAIAVSDTMVFVVPGSRTEGESVTVDGYSPNDCRYTESLAVPIRNTYAMAFAEGTFYFEMEEPSPGLIGLRPVR